LTGRGRRGESETVEPEIREAFDQLRAEIHAGRAESRDHIDARINATVADLRQEIAAATVETRRHVDAAGAETHRHIDAAAAETRRHFDVMTEAVRSDLRAVTEVVLSSSDGPHRRVAELGARHDRLDQRVVELEGRVSVLEEQRPRRRRRPR
jgi:hypothetical protein